MSWGTLLSLAKLRLNVLHVVSHPLGFLLALYHLGAELSAPLHLQETRRQQDVAPEVNFTGSQETNHDYTK